MIVAVISFIAALINIFLCIREVKRTHAALGEGRIPYLRGSVGLAAVLIGFQIFIGAWGAAGLVQDEPIAPLIMNIVLIGCSHLLAARPRLRSRVRAFVSPDGRWPHPQIATVLALVVAGVLTTLALEIPSNHAIYRMYPLCFLLEVGLLTALIAGFFYLFQRRTAAPAIVQAIFFAIGIAEYFVILFKSQPIQPGDLTAIATAAAVGAGYVFYVTSYCLYGLVAFALSLTVTAYVALLRPERPQRTRRGLVTNIVVGALCLAGVTAHITLFDYYNTLNIQVYTWRPLDSYYTQGFIPCFISSAQTIQPQKPSGYTQENAEDLIDSYAAEYDENEGSSDNRAAATEQFDEEQPTVIAIMNETFSDLSIYQNLHADYEGPEYFNSISDALVRGDLYVSAYGGGTCNTEFEFLTGFSMAYLGNGVYPYTIYNLTHAENLAEQFSNLGYTTTAMHPNHATNWNRENVYNDFGFDQFLSIEDFEDADTLRGMVTDASTYDKILELLEEDDSPQFIFDVTMQNHSGYDTGLIPEDLRTDYLIDGVYNSEVNEYLALIEQSDKALQSFIGSLRNLDRPVIVVFFGDHQPFFPSDYNDEWFTDEDDATHSERLYHTEYFIWANYDVAGHTQESDTVDISSNFLGAYMLDLIGAPLSDYQKAQLSLRDAMPAINVIGYQDSTGAWQLSEAASLSTESMSNAAAAATKAREDLAKMQYLKLFDTGDSFYTKTLQGAANETNPNIAPGTTNFG